MSMISSMTLPRFSHREVSHNQPPNWHLMISNGTHHRLSSRYLKRSIHSYPPSHYNQALMMGMPKPSQGNKMALPNREVKFPFLHNLIPNMKLNNGKKTKACLERV